MPKRWEATTSCFNTSCETGSRGKGTGSGEKCTGKTFFKAGMACGFTQVLNIFHPEMLRKQDMLSLTSSQLKHLLISQCRKNFGGKGGKKTDWNGGKIREFKGLPDPSETGISQQSCHTSQQSSLPATVRSRQHAYFTFCKFNTRLPKLFPL